MRRLYALVEACVEHKEPAFAHRRNWLREDNCGTILAMIHGQKLRVLNCHQNTETADFWEVFDLQTRRRTVRVGRWTFD